MKLLNEAQIDRLHAEIMNLPCPPEVEDWSTEKRLDYKCGHRDARHAAAELVAAALRSLAAQPRGTDAQILKERELTVSAIRGAIAFGQQGVNPPPDDPDDHWLAEFWHFGRAYATMHEVLAEVIESDLELSERGQVKLLAKCRAAIAPLPEDTTSDQRAAKEASAWLDANKARLHTADCSYHEPSARCSCGLHRVLTAIHAIKNGNAYLFYPPAPADPMDTPL